MGFNNESYRSIIIKVTLTNYAFLSKQFIYQKLFNEYKYSTCEHIYVKMELFPLLQRAQISATLFLSAMVEKEMQADVARWPSVSDHLYSSVTLFSSRDVGHPRHDSNCTTLIAMKTLLPDDSHCEENSVAGRL